MSAFHRGFGGRVLKRYEIVPGLELVKLPTGLSVEQALARYKASPLVESAEPDYTVYGTTLPNDPSFSSQWSLHNTGQAGGTPDADIDAPEAWDIRTDASSVIVAVIDSGVRYTHEDLAANIWTNPGEIPGNGIDDDGNGYIDDVHGINAINNSGSPLDDNGHGTHVAGILAAVGNNGLGVSGVAQQARILVCKFLNSSNQGSTAEAIECLNYARLRGARIYNNSWGGNGSSSQLQTAINNIRAAGGIFVAGAGNNARDNDVTPFYPASYSHDNIVSVANTTSTDDLSGTSSWGVTSVDLAAPGNGILSTYASGDSDYGGMSGTSMATPHVSGALALLAAQFPSESYTALIGRLFLATDPIASLAGKTVTGGRLNVARALANPALAIADVSLGEGQSGTATATFTVTLAPASAQTVTVDFATADGTASAGSDYVATSGSLTFDPGVTSRTIEVTVLGDALNEFDETFLVNLSGAVNAPVVDNQAQGTIINDDPLPSLSIDDVSVVEGNSGPVAASFTVSLSAVSGRTVTVNYATANGTATSASGDYTAASGTLTFTPGVTTQNVNVTVTGDTVNEASETFVVNLTLPASPAATLADAQGVGTIQNDDPLPALSIGNLSATEGSSGTKTFNFSVSLSPASGQTVTVNYATADGTAVAPGDYTAKSGLLTFTPGATSLGVSVTVISDLLNEADEAFFVNLAGAVNATIADDQGQGSVLDDDPVPNLSINDVSLAEGDSGTTAAGFTVTLSAPSGQTVTVNYATANGTAAAPGDYAAASGTLTFDPGVTTQPVSVAVHGDGIVEVNETFFVNLSGPTNAGITDIQGQGTILNDDLLPSLSIGDVSLAEGHSGTAIASFTVTLSAASLATVTVDYATANGTAAAPGDYTAASDTLTFNPGVTVRTIDVAVNGDTLNEADETFFVNLSAPLNAAIAVAQGVGTIQNDDPVPTLSIGDVSLAEGDSGTTAFVFPVSLSAQSGQTVTVNYATANGTAVAPGDYAATSGTLTFAPGETGKTVSVAAVGELLNEADETFAVSLSGETNAALADGQGVGTIQNDDALPALSIGDVSQAEGNSGNTVATFTVTLSAPSGRTVTVGYATANGSAAAPGDYALASGTLTFAAGETSKTLDVTLNGDVQVEGNETFFVNLSGETNATLADGQGIGTIVNDDIPTLSIGDVSLAEGDSGAVNATFSVTLSAPSFDTVAVNYATADGTALAPGDYAVTGNTLTFDPGITVRTIDVAVAGDTLNEADETFFVNLSAPANATLADGQGQGTIQNDDALPTLSVGDVSLAEGDSGTTALVFPVSLSAASGRTVTVSYATANGTAAAPGDYAATSGLLTFAPGETGKTVSVFVAGELLNEADETFAVNLSGETNATLADGQGVGTIQNDDPLPVLSIDGVTVSEGDSGSVTATFTVTLSAASGRTVTVNYATANDTAVAPDDYSSASGTLTFNPGTTTQTIDIAVIGDLLVEDGETFLVNLSLPVNATLAEAQGQGGTPGQGTILDDDSLSTLSVDDASGSEGNGGTVTFSVTLSGPSENTVTVSYTTVNASAAAPGDYTPVSGLLTFLPGMVSRPIVVPILSDMSDEQNEAFLVVLSLPVNAAIGKGTGQGTILDDDGRPALCQPVAYVPFTVTTSGYYCLTQNLSYAGTSGAAITIAADDVLLDLKSYTLDGSAAGPGTLANGIYASDQGGITLRGGTLQGFRRAVLIEDSGGQPGSGGHRIQGLRVVGNREAGIWVEGDRTVVRRNAVIETGGASGEDVFGIAVSGALSRVLDNDVIEFWASGGGQTAGIRLDSSSGSIAEGNRVTNTVSTPSSTGILVLGGTDVMVLDNRLMFLDVGVDYAGASGPEQDNLYSEVGTPLAGGGS